MPSERSYVLRSGPDARVGIYTPVDGPEAHHASDSVTCVTVSTHPHAAPKPPRNAVLRMVAASVLVGLVLVGLSYAPDSAMDPPAAPNSEGSDAFEEASQPSGGDTLVKAGEGAALTAFGAVLDRTTGSWGVAEVPMAGYEGSEVSPSAVAAVGSYDPADAHASHFGVLHVSSTPSPVYTDEERSFAAGYLEGWLTAPDIMNTAANLWCQVNCDGSIDGNVSEFLDVMDAWFDDVSAEHHSSGEAARTSATEENHIVGGVKTDVYWHHARLVKLQFEGVFAGAQRRLDETGEFDRELRLWDLRIINYLGDLFDIKPAVLHEARVDFGKYTPDEASAILERSGHCSALIRITSDFSELLLGHSSWFAYANMNRIYKHYHLDFWGTANHRISFSSYPGMISSLDDFYMMKDTQLFMTQTTNGIYDTSIYNLTTSLALPAWQRVRMACALATSGEEWSSVIAPHNSGSYNNQYMVVDVGRFLPGQALADGTLWVVEQAPGLVVGKDATGELERGYFPSYNVPYFEEIYRHTGYPTLDARAGVRVGSEYDMAPRASIFRRDAPKVDDLDTLRWFMRSNGWKVGVPADQQPDKLVTSPWAAVCSRGDLNPGGEALMGCYDGKATSATLFRESMGAWVVNGPTNQDGLPSFNWVEIDEDFGINATGSERQYAANAADAFASTKNAMHFGQPNLFDFEYELMSPQWDHLGVGSG